MADNVRKTYVKRNPASDECVPSQIQIDLMVEYNVIGHRDLEHKGLLGHTLTRVTASSNVVEYFSCLVVDFVWTCLFEQLH